MTLPVLGYKRTVVSAVMHAHVSACADIVCPGGRHISCQKGVTGGKEANCYVWRDLGCLWAGPSGKGLPATTG